MRQKRKKISYGSKLPVYFSEEDLRLVRERTLVDPDFGRLAIAESGKLKLQLSLTRLKKFRVILQQRLTIPRI